MIGENQDSMNTEETGFKKWKQKVDTITQVKCGMTCDDLPDVDYWSMYESGVNPTAAANRVIKYAKEN